MKNPSKKLSFILLHEDKIPQFFEIKKNLLKFVIIAFPIILFLFLATLTSGTLYFKKIRDFAKTKESQTLIELRKKNTLLIEQKQENLRTQRELENKLSNKKAQGLENLYLLRPVKGQVDLSNKKIVLFDDFKLARKNKHISLSFNLKKIGTDSSKITGYIVILTQQNNSLKVLPEKAASKEDLQIVFNQGESFGFSKMRPFKLKWPYQGESKLNLKILVFSRSGDLISLKKITQKI